MANIDIAAGQKRRHRATHQVENVKRVRCGSSSEDDCWVSPENASPKAATLLQELYGLLEERSLAEFSHATDEYVKTLENQLDPSSLTRQAYTHFAIAFTNAYKDISHPSEFPIFLKWTIFFTRRLTSTEVQSSAQSSPSSLTNPPELLGDLMATIYRYTSQRVVPYVLSQRATSTAPSPTSSPSGGSGKKRVQAKRRSAPVTDRAVNNTSPLNASAAILLTEFLHLMTSLRHSFKLKDSEIAYLMRIIQNLYLINPVEVPTASPHLSAELTTLQYTAECMLVDQRDLNESRINETMVMITSDILDRDVYIDESTVVGPQRRTPDGLNILRCAALLLRFVMCAEIQEAYQATRTRDVLSVVRHYQDLPCWSERMTPSKWTLESLQGRWQRIREACRALAVTLMGHFNWKASLAKSNDTSALPLKRRVTLMKQIITDVSDAALSPWYPAAPHFLIALCDNLVRMAYDTQKSVIVNQALLELVNHSFLTLARLTQSMELILPMIARNREDLETCACGSLADQEDLEICGSCQRKYHRACLPCEDCVLSKLARDCGAFWLEDFCQCFRPSPVMDTLTRRFPGSSQTPPISPDALPESVLLMPWKGWVILSKFVCLSDRPEDILLRALLSFCASQCADLEARSPPATPVQQAVVEQTPLPRRKGPPTLDQPPRRRRKSRVVADKSDIKEEGSAVVKMEPEVEVVISPCVRIGVPLDECARELISFTFGLSECYSEDEILIYKLAQRSVPELQLHMVLKIWSLALQDAGIEKQIGETMDLLLRIVGAKLMTAIMNPQSMGVKTAESLIETLTSLISCVSSKILKRFSTDLRSLYEDIFRNSKLKFSTRRCLVMNLNRILVAALEKSDEWLLWTSLHPDRKAIFSNAPIISQAEARTPFRTPCNRTKGKRTTLASSKYRKAMDSSETVDSQQSELSLFLLWVTQLCLSCSHPVQTIRLEVWKMLSIVLFALPFKSKTYRLILERLINQLSEEESVTIRSLLLKTIQYLFFSADAVNVALSWQRASRDQKGTRDTGEESSEVSDPTDKGGVSVSNSTVEDLEDIDISLWPQHFQWAGILVMIISFAERKRLTLRTDDGAEKPILECCLTSEVCDGAVMQKLIQLLIDFFVFVRSLRHNSVARFFQRCILKLVTMLTKSHPRVLLQIVPFALPYVCQLPATQSDAQLAAQICPLLEAAIEIDKGILGSVEAVRRDIQPSLFRLTRVRGSLGALATRLLVIIVRNVTLDYAQVLLSLIAKDLNLISRALQRHQVLKEGASGDLLNLSPLFHLNNVDKLRHSFEKIANVVDVIDFPAIIEDGHLTLEQVAKWFETETSQSSVTRADAVPIVLYDLFCDIYLEYRDMRHSPDLGHDRRLLTLESELMSSVVLVLGNLANFYREFIRSSRLTLIFSDALESKSMNLNVQALSSITALFKTPLQTNSRIFLARRGVSRPSTPTSVPTGGCGTRSLQPLCVQVPTICKLVKNLEVPYMIPLLEETEANPEVAVKPARLCVKCRLCALALFHEMIAQGFVTPSDMFETITACILLGDPEIESEASNLAALCLANAPNPAAILRRKASSIMAGFHRYACQRLRYHTEVTRKATSLEEVDFETYIKPFVNWLTRVVRPKALHLGAFLEGLVGSIARVNSLSEITLQLGNADQTLLPSQTILEVFEYTRSYVFYTASFILSIPLLHTGELRQIILNLQSVCTTHAQNLSLDLDSSRLMATSGVLNDEELDTVHLGEDLAPSSSWSMMDQLHKSISRKIISLAVHIMIKSYMKAYHIDDQMRAHLQKRPKESELKHFNFSRGGVETKATDVCMEDLRLPVQQFNEGVEKISAVFMRFRLRKEKDMSSFQEIRIAIENIDIIDGASTPMLIITASHGGGLSSPNLGTADALQDEDE